MEILSCTGKDRHKEIIERFAVELVVRNPYALVKANHEAADTPNPIHVHGYTSIPHLTLFDGRTKHIYEVRTGLSLGDAQCRKRLQVISDYASERQDIIMHLVVPPAAEQRATVLLQELEVDVQLDVVNY